MTSHLVRLGHVVEVNPSVRMSGSPDDLVSFVAMADVSEDGRLVTAQQRRLVEVQKGYTAFQQGDVLLAKITPCFENGKAALVDSLPTKYGFGSTEFHVLRPGKDVDPRFLFHLVWSDSFRRLGTSRMTGSAGQRRVPSAFLADYEFLLPSLAEQQRIAAILDKADSLRRKRQDALRLADEFLKATFFGSFGDIETNHRNWPVLRLEEVALQVTDGEHQTPRRSSNGIFLLSARNVQNGFLALENVDFVPQEEFERIRRRCEPTRGDILISCSGSIGRVAQVTLDEPLALVRSVALVRPDTVRIRSCFLEHLLRSASMQRRMIAASKSSAQANLFQGPIRSLPVMLPPIEEQIRFENIVARVTSLSERSATAADELAALTKSLRSTLLDSGLMQ